MRRLIALLAVALTGCGISAQDAPTSVATSSVPGQTRVEPVEPGELVLPVYFVRGSRLEPVQRRATDRSAQTALGLLEHGPNGSEVTSGLRTALAPQSLTIASLDGTPGVAVIAATRVLAGVSGSNQLLAVAQLVWTVTELPGIDRVRVTLDGAPVEVPTDRGLSGDAVSRRDYMSVAPLPAGDRMQPSSPATTVPASPTPGPTS